MSTKAFPFEKLPPELKNIIYDIVFDADKTVRIHRRETLKATTAKPTDPRKKDLPIKRIPFLPKQGTAILRVNRLTYNEAVSVLYAGRNLVFATAPNLREFFAEYPSRLRFVQNIEVQEGWTTTMGIALATLKDTSRLQRLKICSGIFRHCACESTESLLQHLSLPGMKRFILLGQTAEDLCQRLDIMSFTVSINPCHFHQSSDGIDEAVCAQKAIEVRELVVKMLMNEKAVINRMGITVT